VGALRAFIFENGFERVEPFLGFHYIGIVGGLRHYLVELGRHRASPIFAGLV
jgi:hypothetical protein